MLRLVKLLLAASVGALLLTSAFGVGTASAAYPVQPVWRIADNALIGAGLLTDAEYRFHPSRLWVVNQAAGVLDKFAIRCGAGAGISAMTNALQASGSGKALITFTSCSAHLVDAINGRFVEGSAAVANCNVKTGNEAAGTVKTEQLSSRLVWSEEHQTFILDRFQAATGNTIATILLQGGGCGMLQGTYVLTGSVLANFTGRQDLKPSQALNFEDITAGGNLNPFFKTWRVELGGVVSNGTSSLSLEKQVCPPLMLSAVFSGSMTVELAPVAGFKPPLGYFES
jgi:hypothetical protein